MAQSVSGNVPVPPPSGGSNTTQDANVAKVKITNTGRSILQTCFMLFFILLKPVTFPFAIAGYFFRQTKNITLVVFGELGKVSGLAFNVVELGVLVVQAVNIILFKDGNTKPLMPRMMDVYNRMANTLIDIHALPSTKESGAMGHLMLSRLPVSIWDKLLPYPHPFFKGSVTQACKSDSKLITSMQVVPSDQYSPVPPAKKTK